MRRWVSAFALLFACALGFAPGAARAVVIAQSVAIRSQSVARQVVAPWQPLSLSVTADGIGTLSYQWRHNNRPIAGAVNATYSLSNVRYADAGAYTVDVADSRGTVTSAPMFVLVAPSRTELVAWGRSDAIPGDQTDLVAVSAGDNYVVAVRADGSVASWGRTETVPSGLKDAVAVAAGSDFSLALKSDGTVVAWGNPSSPCLNLPANLSGVVAITAGTEIAGAVQSDGFAVVWGANGLMQTWLPDASHHAQAVGVGSLAPLILTTEGSVVSLQGDLPAQLAYLAGIHDAVALSSAGYHALVLKSDGTLADVGNYYVIAAGLTYTPINVPIGLSSVVGVAAGEVHSLALMSDGSVRAWGQAGIWAGDSYGQATVPASLTQAIAVSAAGYTSLALRDGSGDNVPTVATQPADLSVGRGEWATFSVAATGGNAPVSYQWRHNGINIVGR